MNFRLLASLAFSVDYDEVTDWHIESVKRAWRYGNEMKRIRRTRVWEAISVRLIILFAVGSSFYTFLCIVGWLLELVS